MVPMTKKKKILPRDRHFNYTNGHPYEVIQRTHNELFHEIQYKYPGLYNLSRKTGHKLLDEIAKIIFGRVKDIMEANVETRDNCFKLSNHYRKMHPHFGDFQMILSTLHSLQDASGAPRLQIQEKELLQQTLMPCTINNLSFEAVRTTADTYSEKVFKAMFAHINSLDSTLAKGDTEEAHAKKKVRKEMKKMLPFMSNIVRHVALKHFTPQKSPMHSIRIYGEPFLPSKDAMAPFMRRYHADVSRVIRHPRMFNLLLFKVQQHQYGELMATDGTVINGAKLVIRSDNPMYLATPELRSEMSAALGGPRDEAILPMEDDVEDDLDQKVKTKIVDIYK